MFFLQIYSQVFASLGVSQNGGSAEWFKEGEIFFGGRIADAATINVDTSLLGLGDI